MLGGKCVKRTYEKGVKGYVHHVTGPPGLKMQLPADERRGRERPPASRTFPAPPPPRDFSHPRGRRAGPRDLPLDLTETLPKPRIARAVGLKQPYLVFQMLLPAGQHVSLEIVVADQEGTRRRLILSTSFCDVKSTPLHAQVPLPDALVPRDRWTNLALDLPALTATLWAEQRAEFRSAEGVSVGSTCALRKIFTAKSPPQEHGVDPEVSREAARIKDTTTEGGGGHARVTARNDGSLGIRGVGCGPGDASRTQPAGTRLAVPEPVPRAADFLPGVERTTVLLDPAKLMACRVAGLPTTNDADVEGRGWDDEGGFGGLRITGKGGGHHHHLSTSAPTSGRKQHPSSGGVSSRGHSREGAGVHLAFGTRVASTPPSRGRSRPTSQGYRDEGNGAGGAARRWSPTNGATTNGVHSRDGTPRSDRTRAERFNEDLASYFAAQGHGRSSGFIDRLSNRRNSADGYNSGGPGFPVDLPHVDARPKLPSSPGGRAGGGLISRGSHEWDDDMAALGDLGASISPKGAASGRRSVTFGLASPKTPGATPGAGSRRTHAASQPRAHTVGASPRSRGARLSTGAGPIARSRSGGLDFGPSLRSREGGSGFDDVDLGGSMRVSSLSHSFDAGDTRGVVNGVVNHFPGPGRRSRLSGSGSPGGGGTSPNDASPPGGSPGRRSPSSGSVGSEPHGDEERERESALARGTAGASRAPSGYSPQPPPGSYSSARYADASEDAASRARAFDARFDAFDDDDDDDDAACVPNMRHSELGLSNSSLDRFVVNAGTSGGRNAPAPLVIPGGPEEDDAVVTTVEPPERSIASPMHPHGFGGYDDDFQLAADLNSPSAGLDGRPGRRTYGGRGRGGRGRGSVERTIQTPSKLHGFRIAGGLPDGAEKEEGGGVYMDGEGPGGSAAALKGHPSTGDEAVRASRAASEVGDEDPAELLGTSKNDDDDDDDRGFEPIAETLEPHRDSNGIAYYPNGSAPTGVDDDDGLGLSSDDESGLNLRMMRESQIIGVSDMPSRWGHSSGDGGWGGIGRDGGWSRPGTGSSSIWGKQTNGRGFSTPAGLRLFTPDLVLSGGERRSTVPPPMRPGAIDAAVTTVTTGTRTTTTTHDADGPKEQPGMSARVDGSKEPLHAVNGEATVARGSGPRGSKPNSPSFAGENDGESEGENKEEPAELDLIYDPLLNYYFDPKSNTYYELKT